MSRPKPRRAVRANDSLNSRNSALRAELQVRLDQLRASIESKRREGWTVVRCPGPDPDKPT